MQGEGDRIPRSPSRPPPPRTGDRPAAGTENTHAGKENVELPAEPQAEEPSRSVTTPTTPKAPSPSGPHEKLRHALQSFDEGTPEGQAATMFLRYMEDTGMMPPAEGQVSKKVR